MAGRPSLLDILERAQSVGLLGPGPVAAHVDHARAWAGALGPAPESFLDLGCGGGVPGLILLAEWPEASATLLDGRSLAARTVETAAEELGWDSRVTTVAARAEEAGRDPGLRERFPLVVARGFGAPAETAECGAAFVAASGRLSVSEPPGGDPGRWPAGPLAELGLGPAETVVTERGSFAILPRSGPLPDRFPRRTGVPRRRPLW
jgi:16S rRNA (guanine527-N7)-methyltransferase